MTKDKKNIIIGKRQKNQTYNKIKEKGYF